MKGREDWEEEKGEVRGAFKEKEGKLAQKSILSSLSQGRNRHTGTGFCQCSDDYYLYVRGLQSPAHDSKYPHNDGMILLIADNPPLMMTSSRPAFSPCEGCAVPGISP